jgi:UDP-glucose 4-epimerase
MEEFSGKSILISGGAGFVGSNLTKYLLACDIKKINIVDNFISSEKTNIPSDSRIIFTQNSIADDNTLKDIHDEFDYIFHLATYHGNQSSIADPIADHDNNLITTLKLCEHVKDFRNLKRIVYSGAGCAVAEKTFSQAHATPEDAPISLNMDSPYSISKIAGEFYMVYYFNHYGLPSVRARFQNVYGPGEILGAGKWRGTPATVWRNVIPIFIYKAVHGQPLPIEGDGTATRDFIYVNDIIMGLLACALKGKPGEVYNLASGSETSIYNLALLINKLTGNTTPLDIRPKRKWDNSGKRFGSTVKSKKELNFSAKTDLEIGLTKTIYWTNENLDLIKKCIARHQSELSLYKSQSHEDKT